jgi:hypothetical protein
VSLHGWSTWASGLIGDGSTPVASLPRLSKGDPGPQGDDGPQGLPGVNAVANDTAVAGYIGTTGTSATQDALDGRYAKIGSAAVPR